MPYRAELVILSQLLDRCTSAKIEPHLLNHIYWTTFIEPHLLNHIYWTTFIEEGGALQVRLERNPKKYVTSVRIGVDESAKVMRCWPVASGGLTEIDP